ncbi:hypothetical protein RIF29_29466 [Crotalaria pallida]|uniref:Uncharacterized protein n=1 Tax=Crotalaria pallida TaxID=3830 RepID=A0AAN9EEL9_CROPI
MNRTFSVSKDNRLRPQSSTKFESKLEEFTLILPPKASTAATDLSINRPHISEPQSRSIAALQSKATASPFTLSVPPSPSLLDPASASSTSCNLLLTILHIRPFIAAPTSSMIHSLIHLLEREDREEKVGWWRRQRVVAMVEGGEGRVNRGQKQSNKKEKKTSRSKVRVCIMTKLLSEKGWGKPIAAAREHCYRAKVSI